MIVQSEAPSEMRIAISRCRAVARVSIRLAMLPIAISSTKITAPISMLNAGFKSPTSCACIGFTTASIAILSAEYCAYSRLAIVLISARAWLNETPGFSRAMALMPGCQERSSGSLLAHGPMATTKSGACCSNSKCSGSTPITV